MTPKTATASSLIFALGLTVGMALSDAAALQGFPHKPYIVELTHDSSNKANFDCMKLAAVVQGGNLSELSPSASRQEQCILLLYGDAQPDGSFDAYGGTQTWVGRVTKSSLPTHISNERIKSLAVSDDWSQAVRVSLWRQFWSNF